MPCSNAAQAVTPQGIVVRAGSLRIFACVLNPISLLQRSLTIVLSVLLLLLIAVEASSLFVFPVPDSIRWYGDESWLMPESIALAKTGLLYHPYALASTLNVSKSLLFISFPWIRELIYGMPAAALFPQVNPVDVGRVVSWLGSIFLIGVTFWYVRKRTGDLQLALATAITLVATKALLFASHSARPDIFVGSITLIAALAFAHWRVANKYRWFWLSFVSVLVCIGLPIHLFFYLAAIGLAAFVIHAAYRKWSSWIGIIGGVALAIVLAFSIQWMLVGDTDNGRSNETEFKDVTRDIPLLKPFSLSVQRTAFSKHVELVVDEATILLALIPALLYFGWKRRKTHRLETELTVYSLVALFIWYFVQRPHPAYLIHAWPLVLVAAALQLRHARAPRVAFMVLSCVFAIILLVFTSMTGKRGEELTRANETAVNELAAMISTESPGRPLVMSEAASMKVLLTQPNIRLMSTHFQFFPERKESIEATLEREGVDYAILFNTPHYGYDRNAIDPLVKTVKAKGDLLATRTGQFFDINDDYIDLATAPSQLDTFFLYKLRK